MPELALNGQVIKTGTPMRLGEELPFTFAITYQGANLRPYTYPVIAGSYLSVAVIGGNVSPTTLQDLQTKVEQTKTTLETGDANLIGALTREDLLGDLFYAGTLGYYAQLTTLSSIMAIQQQTHHYLAAGYGTFGYEPNVDYFFGIPRSVTVGGLVMNVPMVGVIATNTPDQNKKKTFAVQVGTLSSALEHAVPEHLFTTDRNNPADAISAVKALQKAGAQGQRIYQITKTNQGATLPAIHHDQATMQEIQAALAIGKEVITHTDAVSVPRWSGAGYIILDPLTGEGAYKIGGGQNGSFLDYYPNNAASAILFLLGLAIPLATVSPALPVVALLIVFQLFHIFMVAMIIDLQARNAGCGSAGAAMVGGMAIGFFFASRIFGPAGSALVTSFFNFLAGNAVRSTTSACGNLHG